MREHSALMELKPAFCGIVVGSEAAAQTAYGATIDTLGFADVLATIAIGSVYGTAAATATVTVQFQEATSANGSFTDIDDGAINGTMALSIQVIGHTALTTPALFMGKIYERLGSGGQGGVLRSRYIRPHISTVGTAASKYGFAISVNCLLGRPLDTLYIQNPSLLATGNSAYGGSVTPSYKV